MQGSGRGERPAWYLRGSENGGYGSSEMTQSAIPESFCPKTNGHCRLQLLSNACAAWVDYMPSAFGAALDKKGRAIQLDGHAMEIGGPARLIRGTWTEGDWSFRVDVDVGTPSIGRSTNFNAIDGPRPERGSEEVWEAPVGGIYGVKDRLRSLYPSWQGAGARPCVALEGCHAGQR